MQIYRSCSDCPAWNLAAEEYLMRRESGPSPLEYLLLYVNRPSVILGNNQAWQNEIDRAFCRVGHIEIARRMSGGGAVYHDRGNLNFCFIGPRSEHPLDGSFLQAVREILFSLGLPVEQGKRKDLWINGAKVSGTASQVGKYRELHHGTLLYDADLEQLNRALLAPRLLEEKSPSRMENGGECAKSVPSVPSKVTNLRIFMKKDLLPEFFFDTFAAECGNYYGCGVHPFGKEEESAIDELYRQKYSTDAWIFRK